jgi:hypothetical protein
MTLGTVAASGATLILTANGNIDGGTFRGGVVHINASQAGTSSPVTADVNENNLYAVLTTKNASSISGIFGKGPALTATPPPGNLTAIGTVIFQGLGTFLSGELAEIEGAITSLASASKEQEILDEMLRAAREAQYFMKAPLEIFIEMEEEEKDKRKDGEEAFYRLSPELFQQRSPAAPPTWPTLLSDLPEIEPPAVPDGKAPIRSIFDQSGNPLDRVVSSLTR